MSKKHLTLSDRIIIQTGLQQHLSLAKIAEKAGVSRSTVSREIKARRRLVKTSGGNNCIQRNTCTRVPGCRSTCFRGKRQCQSACGGCNEVCTEYQEEFCADYEKTPYTCNGCDQRMKCRLRRMLYDAQTAQEQYETLLSESRKGISLTEEELTALNSFVTPKIKAGLSIPIICEIFRDLFQIPRFIPMWKVGFWKPGTLTCAEKSVAQNGKKAVRSSGWTENVMWNVPMMIRAAT